MCAEAATPLPILDSLVETAAKIIATNLHSADTELLGYIMLYFKSVLGAPLTLGEMDTYTVMGKLDPKHLGMKFYGNTPAVVTVDAATS